MEFCILYLGLNSKLNMKTFMMTKLILSSRECF